MTNFNTEFSGEWIQFHSLVSWVNCSGWLRSFIPESCPPLGLIKLGCPFHWLTESKLMQQNTAQIENSYVFFCPFCFMYHVCTMSSSSRSPYQFIWRLDGNFHEVQKVGVTFRRRLLTSTFIWEKLLYIRSRDRNGQTDGGKFEMTIFNISFRASTFNCNFIFFLGQELGEGFPLHKYFFL